MEFHAQSGIYHQIATRVIERIASGEWPSGARIPSVRDLAAEIMVNPNTVMRAYAQLQDEGLIANQRGVGFFVAPDGPGKVRQLKKNAFLSELLPQMFKEMALLGIDWQELEIQYQHFQQQQKLP